MARAAESSGVAAAMRWRLPLLAVVSASMAFAPLLGRAQTQSQQPSSDPLVEARDARVWLTRIQDAANKRNYQGTVVVSAGGTVASSRIAHFCEGSDQYERIDSLDGQMRHVFRQNDVVHTVWPQNKVAMVEQREGVSSFPALLQQGADRVPEFYDMKQLPGVERVAGRESQVLVLKPKDAHRFGHRLWVDQASGLLLRTEVLNERHEVLESSAFSEVSIGIKPQFELVVHPLKKLDGYRVLKPALVPAKLEAEGWQLKHNVPGFKLVSCTKRPSNGPLAQSSNAAASDAQMLQAVYSDGLTYVSLFIEPYDAERHTRPIVTAIGATQTMMRRLGDWWITAMGDVPAATLRQFFQGLERKK